jgi:hypothetical protein
MQGFTEKKGKSKFSLESNLIFEPKVHIRQGNSPGSLSAAQRIQLG